MRWAVQWEFADVPNVKRKWKRLAGTERDSHDEAVALLKGWQEKDLGYEHRLVRLVTKSEKLRAAIVKKLRELARGPALVMSAREAQFSAVMLGTRILELADRIERGEVG